MAPRIVLHFHPGWGFADGTVLDAIATSGWYRSQWQTGTSNDSVYHPQTVGGLEKLELLCQLADSRVVDPSVLPSAAADLPLDDPLNDYVEAHVHGGLSVTRDVEAVVLDPTDRKEHSETVEQLGCPVEEHPGYCVTADAIDPDYRGPVPVELAGLLGGQITPARLANASRSGDHDPQAVKWLWHCLARFGRQWPTHDRPLGSR